MTSFRLRRSGEVRLQVSKQISGRLTGGRHRCHYNSFLSLDRWPTSVSSPPRCVVCGQMVSRRGKQRRGGRKNTTTDSLWRANDVTDPAAQVSSSTVDDVTFPVRRACHDDDVCPACDSQLSPQSDPTWRAQWSTNTTPSLKNVGARAPNDYYKLTAVNDNENMTS